MLRRISFLLACLCLFAAVAPAQTWTMDAYYGTSGSAENPSLLASNGLLYGLDSTGIFTILLPSGLYATLNPSPGLSAICLEGTDGNLYGVSTGGQLAQISLSGTVNIFSSGVTISTCPILASDGNYYGGTSSGGDYGYGYLYEITAAGAGTVLYDFTKTFDGVGPVEPLTESTNGYLYGFSSTSLFRFSPASGLEAFPLGGAYTPQTAPIEGPDGNFYSYVANYAVSLPGGGSEIAPGFVFKMTPAGQMTTLYTISSANVAIQGLTMGGDGSLYEVEDDYSGPSDCFGEASAIVLNPLSLSGTLGTAVWTIDGYEGSTFYNAASMFQGGSGAYYGGLEGESGYYNPETDQCEESTGYYAFAEAPSTPPASTPITMSVNATHVVAGGKVTLNWKVNNAFSENLKQCYGYGVLSGKLPLSGSLTAYPAAGTYTAAIVCGGTETSSINLAAGNATISAGATTPIYAGNSESLYAYISPTGYTPGPTGSVSFYSGSTLLGTSPVTFVDGYYYSAGLTLPTTGIAPGTYPVTAKYSGDSHYGPATQSFTITVLPRVATTMSATPSSQSVVIGRTLSLLASLTGSATYHPPSGTITFSEGGTVLSSTTLAGNSYTPTATLSENTVGQAPGTYTITAAYSGDLYNVPSSATATVMLIQQKDAITLTATPNPVPANTAVTLTATATGSIATPTGDVVFYADGVALAGDTLNSSGVASVQIPASEFKAGTYQVQAKYLGDTNNPPVNSQMLALTVK